MARDLRLLFAVAVCAVIVPVGATAAPPDRAASTPVMRDDQTASASSISKSQLSSRLTSLLNQAGGSSGAWVYNFDGSDTVYAHGAGTSRPLASNEKLFTTGTGLDRFGPETRLETGLWQVGNVDSEGVLDGDLYLVGAGDPALGSSSWARGHTGGVVTRLGRIAERAHEKGLRRVTGQLYVDDTLFDRKRGTPATSYRISSEIGPLSALTYNSGHRRDGSFAPTPELYTGKRLISSLRNNGVKIGADVNHRVLPDAADVDPDPDQLVAKSSPSLETLAAATNKPSNNFFAETLLKGIGAAFAGGGTTSQGAAEVQSFAAGLGASVNAVDGSGLGRSNTAPPREVGEFLVAMRSHVARKEFTASLPKAGREGTVANRMRGTEAAGRCRTKTGTLSDVSNLSGYCFNRSGRTMVFSILMKNIYVPNAQAIQDRMAHYIASY